MTEAPQYPPPNPYYPPNQPPAPVQPESKPFYKKAWFWIVAVLVLVIIFALAGSGDDKESRVVEQPSVSRQESKEPVAPSRPTEEQAFIATLDAGDIYYSSEKAAIDVGHNACDALDSNVSPNELIEITVKSGGYSYYDAGFILGASVGAFCPEHINMID